MNNLIFPKKLGQFFQLEKHFLLLELDHRDRRSNTTISTTT